MEVKKKKRKNSSKVKSKKRISSQLTVQNKTRGRGKSREYYQDRNQVPDVESNEIFAFIAGYTSGGFPYGITWEEMERMADEESLYATLPREEIPSSDES